MRTLDLAEAAAFLGLHPHTLQARAKAGQVPGSPARSRRPGRGGGQSFTRWRNHPKTKRSSFSRRSASSM